MEEYTAASAPDQSVRKKLNGMFTRYDWVGIRNVLKVDFSWPVALEQNEIVNMGQADGLNEERMAQSGQGTFLPGDGATRQQGKIVKVVLAAGEKRMIMGEAAYVVVPRLFTALVRQKYGTDKTALAKLRNPSIQAELLKEIVVGPVINNIGEAMETYVNDKMTNMQAGFSDVQVAPEEKKVTGGRQATKANAA